MSTQAVILVDHGSRLAESNALVERIAADLATRLQPAWICVEPAHMELAEPSIATAYARCVAQGARTISVLPYFLGPGKHWTTDIPTLVELAAAGHPETTWQLAAPLGHDPLLLDLLQKRLTDASPPPNLMPAAASRPTDSP